MKNVLENDANMKLFGRLLFASRFVADEDVRNKNILDIGCGFGWCEVDFVKRGASKIVGMEMSEDDIATAKGSVKNEKAEFKIGSAIDLPFADNTFDTVVSWEVLEHIPKQTELRMFSEVSRVLKDGGTFYLSTPYRSFFSNLLDPAWVLVGHRHYSRKKIEQFAKNNSLEVLEVVVRGGWWTSFSSINMYISKWIFRRERIFNEYFQKNEDYEFENKAGFNNIFVKSRKI